MRRSRQRCSDSQCFFSILPLAAALKLPEGDKGQCGTCFGWRGDDAVPSETGRTAQLLGSTCTQRSPYRQGLKSSGCQRFTTSTVTPQRGQRPVLQDPTHLLHILCVLLGRFTSLCLCSCVRHLRAGQHHLLCSGSGGGSGSHPKHPAFCCLREKQQ